MRRPSVVLHWWKIDRRERKAERAAGPQPMWFAINEVGTKFRCVNHGDCECLWEYVGIRERSSEVAFKYLGPRVAAANPVIGGVYYFPHKTVFERFTLTDPFLEIMRAKNKAERR